MSESAGKAPFERRLSDVALWAAARASLARELGLEGLALGFALASAHLLFVVVPRAMFTFLDLVVLILTIGGGIFVWGFEVRRGSALGQLSKKLQEEADVAGTANNHGSVHDSGSPATGTIGGFESPTFGLAGENIRSRAVDLG